jgi:uncharacterized protein Yka (UPF0111/DUF47 family)
MAMGHMGSGLDMTAKERFRAVHHTARLNVKAQLSNAGRLDLWGLELKPKTDLVVNTSIRLGFSRTDTVKLVHLLKDTLAVRAI